MTAFDLVAAFLVLLPGSPAGQEGMAPPAPLPAEQRRMVPPVPPGEVVTREIVVRLIKVRGPNAKKLCKALRTIYGDRPGFKIDAFKDLNMIIVSGDEKTVEQISEILRLIQPLGSTDP